MEAAILTLRRSFYPFDFWEVRPRRSVSNVRRAEIRDCIVGKRLHVWMFILDTKTLILILVVLLLG